MRNVPTSVKNRAAKKLNSSKKTKGKRVLGLNSAKQEAGEWFYTLTDMESVVAAVLDELDQDPGATITLEASETGIQLNVTTSDGEEVAVDVDLDIEGDETPDADVDDMPEEFPDDGSAE